MKYNCVYCGKEIYMKQDREKAGRCCYSYKCRMRREKWKLLIYLLKGGNMKDWNGKYKIFGSRGKN